MWEPQSVKFNLIKNPAALEKFNHWKINENGGDGWKIEDLPVDGEEHFPNPSVTKYFVSSYKLCLLSQLIDLKQMGYNDDIMDNYQPNIVITDWYAGRRDCGSEYQLLVQLLSKDKKSIQEFCPQPVAIGKCNDIRWQHMTHMFSNYGPGVRYVYFQHGGNSTQNWAGSYGARVTNSSVSIEI